MILTKLELKRAGLVMMLCALASCAALIPVNLSAAQDKPPTQTQATPTNPTTPAQPAPAVRLNLIVIDEQRHTGAAARREEVSVFEDNIAQTITYFEKETLPVSYALLVDNSGSMKPVLEMVVRTCGSLVVANKPGDETAIIRFVDSEEIKILELFTDSKQSLGEALALMRTEGGQTALIDAVYLAVETVAERRRDDPARRRAIVLITDGDDRSSYYKSSQLQKLIRESGVQAFVIGFTQVADREGGLLSARAREKATKLLDSIAQESGGRTFYPKKVPDLVAAVGEIARDLRTQYVVGYESTNAARDGKFRKVEVKIADTPTQPKRIAVTRSGYFAAGGEPRKKDKK
ncbi:MAG: VWA domain-containing protein [Acidobacteria bacterium]|nr:VWA domain-containing protein [Acidobacteriota bacterium]MCA1641623.1 VWA domain-containing protein [Acidobacteriota bacterium]